MQYTISKIDNGIATVVFENGSWAEVVLSSDMTEQDVDDAVNQFAPKTGSAPAFLSVGQTRTAQAKPADQSAEEVVPEPQWLQDRKEAYGSSLTQLEYITENGLDAWQTHVAEIKAMIPKE